MDPKSQECLERVREWRWSGGLVCPRCRSSRCHVHMHNAASGRRKLLCASCGRAFNDLTGLPFARSHLPLWKWFLCARRLLEGPATCAELARRAQVKVATAWRVRRVLSRALLDSELRRLFQLGALLLLLGLPRASAQEWPAPPAQPRLRFARAIPDATATVERGRAARILDFLLGLVPGTQPRARKLSRPTGIFARDGKVWVADPGSRGVFVHDLAKGESAWLPKGRSDLQSPVAVAVSTDSRVFIADPGLGRVLILGPDGRVQGELAGDPEGAGRPSGLAFGAGRLFVSDSARHRVSAYGLDGVFLYSFGGRGSEKGRFNFPTYLWFDEATGRLWVVDSGNFRLQAFDPLGSPTAVLGEAGDRPGYLARPRGLAVDSEGHLFVADAAFEAVQVFDAQGRLLLFVGQAGSGRGEFALLGGLAFDGSDRLFVADTYNSRVQVFQYLKEGKP